MDEEPAILTFAERQQLIYEGLDTYMGLLDAIFTFGNTLELIYVGGMLHKPAVMKDRVEPLPTLIPLYVEFKAKKCHQCSRPIVNYKYGLFCSNIFQGLSNLDHACYKFVCKDCLGAE